ncbi:hypothetical protein ACXATD_000724 [Clostridium sporogenes]|nr:MULTISPECIES: hypothetical protein [Clostridium]MDU1420341.1 hypothetical protein [Clostridium botulinum]
MGKAMFINKLRHITSIIAKGDDLMNFLRWVASIILMFSLISFLFKLGSIFINSLLLLATTIFIIDIFMEREKIK